MKFTKMQCSGSDFVFINCFDEIFENTSAASEFFCDRHFGIGCDNLILVMKSVVADYKLRIYCPDGSETECSVSGIACAFKYLYDNNYIDNEVAKLETMSGVYKVFKNGDKVIVNIGEPVFTPQLIPVDYTGDEFINKIISVNNEEYSISCISVGTPHAVVFIDNLNDLEIEKLGRSIELHQIFPKRTNVESVRKAGDNILVIGLGSIGLIMAQAIKAMGYNVFACDLLEERINIAKEKGIESFNSLDLESFDKIMKEKTAGFGVDAVFMTSGADKAIDVALKTIKMGGKILVFSSTPNNFGYANNEIYYKELTVMGSYSPSSKDLEDSFKLLASEKVNVKNLTTTYSLERIQEAFEDTITNKIFKAYIFVT